ncbi:MAG: cupin domain-containing protein [Gammaproteobacteria bacterium]|nr:cupin domain-containing protein [Gammaproteobacteria bacterium]
MPKATPISIKAAFTQLKFLSNRTPETTDEHAKDAFATLSKYRDGGVFIGHYAGNSQWERHSNGDEIVLVVEGETTLILLSDSNEVPNALREGEFLVVPKNTWHRFETPKGVKVMAVTPQPTDHSIERPEDA